MKKNTNMREWEIFRGGGIKFPREKLKITNMNSKHMFWVYLPNLKILKQRIPTQERRALVYLNRQGRWEVILKRRDLEMWRTFVEKKSTQK